MERDPWVSSVALACKSANEVLFRWLRRIVYVRILFTLFCSSFSCVNVAVKSEKVYGKHLLVLLTMINNVPVYEQH